VNNRIDILKGTHPGRVIAYDMNKNHTSQNTLAETIGVTKQMINAVIAGRRDLSVELALRIEAAMGYDEGFLSHLQTLFNIDKVKREWSKAQYKTAPNIRRNLFWDYDFDNLDWSRYQKAIIHRVLEKGTAEDKCEIARFYNIPLNMLAEHSLPEKTYSPKL
jgi:addiction module HigA family antidote